MKWKVIMPLVALLLLASVQVVLAGGAYPEPGSPLGRQNLKYIQCGCGQVYPRPNDELLEAGAVFTGEVLSITDLPIEDSDALRSKRVVFKVISRWKNAGRSEVTLDTGSGKDDCGLEFKPGEIWVVYMNRSRIADKCTRTRLLEDAGEDIAQLGQGRPPLSADLLARVKSVESVQRLQGVNLFGRLGLAALILAACIGGPAVYYRRKWPKVAVQ